MRKPEATRRKTDWKETSVLIVRESNTGIMREAPHPPIWGGPMGDSAPSLSPQEPMVTMKIGDKISSRHRCFTFGAEQTSRTYMTLRAVVNSRGDYKICFISLDHLLNVKLGTSYCDSFFPCHTCLLVLSPGQETPQETKGHHLFGGKQKPVCLGVD